MRQNGTRLISNPVDEQRGQKIHRKLYAEVDGNDHGNLIHTDPVLCAQRHKQQGREIVDDSLYHVSDETGVNGMLVVVSDCFQHGCLSLCLIQLHLSVCTSAPDRPSRYAGTESFLLYQTRTIDSIRKRAYNMTKTPGFTFHDRMFRCPG